MSTWRRGGSVTDILGSAYPASVSGHLFRALIGSWEPVAKAVCPRPYSLFMRVLVVGTEDWAIEQTAGELARKGCQVLTCHDPGEPAFPCNAVLPGKVCPLTAGFEVAVTVRTRPLDQPATGEMGA